LESQDAPQAQAQTVIQLGSGVTNDSGLRLPKLDQAIRKHKPTRHCQHTLSTTAQFVHNEASPTGLIHSQTDYVLAPTSIKEP